MIKNEWPLPSNFLTTKNAFTICNITKSVLHNTSYFGERWRVDSKSISTLFAAVSSTGGWDAWKRVDEISGTSDSSETGAANFKAK